MRAGRKEGRHRWRATDRRVWLSTEQPSSLRQHLPPRNVLSENKNKPLSTALGKSIVGLQRAQEDVRCCVPPQYASQLCLSLGAWVLHGGQRTRVDLEWSLVRVCWLFRSWVSGTASSSGCQTYAEPPRSSATTPNVSPGRHSSYCGCCSGQERGVGRDSECVCEASPTQWQSELLAWKANVHTDR